MSPLRGSRSRGKDRGSIRVLAVGAGCCLRQLAHKLPCEMPMSISTAPRRLAQSGCPVLLVSLFPGGRCSFFGRHIIFVAGVVGLERSFV